MAKKVKKEEELTPRQKAQRFLRENPNFDPNKTPVTRGVEGVRFQSKEYGCYDSGMPPHPSWNVPKQWMIGRKEINVQKVYYIGSNDKEAVITAQYHPYPDFYLPESVTFMTDESASTKLSKNARKSLVLYMSPVRRNSFGYNTCSMASQACEAVCLDYSGQKVGQQKQRLAIARTDFFFAHEEAFFSRVLQGIIEKDREVNKSLPLSKRAEIAVRLNGTSDLPVFNDFAKWCVRNGVKMPKNIVFYDYTKVAKNVTTHADIKNPTTNGNEYNNDFLKIQPESPVRHKVTFSLSETFHQEKGLDSRFDALEVLKNGGTVAAVFLTNPRGIPMFASKEDKAKNKRKPRPKMADGTPYVDIVDKYYEPLPQNFCVIDRDGQKHCFPIVDGDTTDDLMLDLPKGGHVLGLRAKMRAQYDTTGFAIPAVAIIDPKDPKQRALIKEVEFDFRKNRETIMLACNPNVTKTERPRRYKCSDDQIKTGAVIDVW